MEPTDLTLEVLRSIRDEIAAFRSETRAELTGLNERVDGLNGRVDGLNDRLEHLERRQTETEIRLATELVAVGEAVHRTNELLQEHITIRPKVMEHERRITVLETKAGVVG